MIPPQRLFGAATAARRAELIDDVAALRRRIYSAFAAVAGLERCLTGDQRPPATASPSTCQQAVLAVAGDLGGLAASALQLAGEYPDAKTLDVPGASPRRHARGERGPKEARP